MEIEIFAYGDTTRYVCVLLACPWVGSQTLFESDVSTHEAVVEPTFRSISITFLSTHLVSHSVCVCVCGTYLSECICVCLFAVAILSVGAKCGLW